VGAPFVTVIIPTRERPDLLTASVQSILASDYPADRYEVVVVDNRPETQATERALEALVESGAVRYTRCDLPGQAHARNHAVRETKGDPLLFTDDDVVVDRAWIAEMVKGFDDPHVACVTGRVAPFELETPAQALFEEFGGHMRDDEPRLFDLGPNRPRDPLFPYNAGRFGTGNSMAFRRRVLEELGGFAPISCHGVTLAEDLDAFLRTILAGHTIGYRPSAVVYHRHRRDYADLRRQVRLYGMAVTALLTKTIIDRPSVALDLIKRAPAGVRYALSDASTKNQYRSRGYPRELKLLELAGFAAGPWAYLRDRRRAARGQ
jgi:cellulose synthase/poly-beta-1,6-N-acetylglucosamine synthase-like glycosyltransferase